MSLSRLQPHPIAEYAADLLRELSLLLQKVPHPIFQKTDPGVRSASIGAHVRHILDHFSSWQLAAGEGRVDYDQRQRDVLLETDRQLASDRLLQFADSILRHSLEPSSLTLEGKTRPEDPAFVLASTSERELHYVAMHCLHHMATIALLARLQGVDVPNDFGKARPTLWHEREKVQDVAI